ncbi:MAG: PASTA domain-containing protein [Kaiparowitsia implicata GSE-PSE-MK54-09C]|jgi:beta-lactam-binding protein with PASTA domain|nr:PASTA domain-containing protein [Kaiparowitsia implicata GSE-PSE-MK54-09C]
MVFNSFASRFVVNTILAERQGVTDPTARTRVALLGGLLGPSATGLVVTTVLARREAEDQTQQIPPAPSASDLVMVPNVLGQSFAAAQENLKAVSSQFKIQLREVGGLAEDVGVVLYQEPASGGKPVAATSSITLYISRQPAPNRAALPHVIGMTRDEAVQRLSSLGLVISEVEVNSNQPQGWVVMQSRDAGTQVVAGEPLTLLISSGVPATPEQVELPNVIGQHYVAAERLLNEKGFCVQVETVNTGGTGADVKTDTRVVVDQMPKGGDGVQVSKGSKVVLTVQNHSSSPGYPQSHAASSK